MRPALDGVISAFHGHDGSELDELSQRLGRALGADPASVARSLMNDSEAVLGKRRLLWPRATGVQWNPGDDRSLAAEVHVRAGRIGGLSLSGTMFGLEAVDEL